MNITYVLSIIFAVISLIKPTFSRNKELSRDLSHNNTVYEPNGQRFQRILRRKRRFLIFPPGSAIVVCFFKLNFEKLEKKLFER